MASLNAALLLHAVACQAALAVLITDQAVVVHAISR